MKKQSSMKKPETADERLINESFYGKKFLPPRNKLGNLLLFVLLVAAIIWLATCNALPHTPAA